MTETRRLGKYRLSRRLAVGGAAEVYLAVAEGLSGFEKRVVLKRLIPEYARDPELLSMFLDEARLMALFSHPNITEVYDIGSQDGEYFFALEHVDGCDLRDLLDAQPGQPLPLAAALTVTVAVAEGLEHAHGQRSQDGELLGVVHRDVTPSNVLCGRQGAVKLVDFGVAKWTAQRSRTEQGTIKGKFAYMSPEQCRAESLDRRSDVFALGVILHELTTGRKPFVGESEFEVLSAIVAGRTIPPSTGRPDYPASLEAVVMRALATDRAQRFATAGELGDALVQIAAELGLTLGAPTVAELVRARQPALEHRDPPATEPSRPVAGRTATDLAMAPTERAALLGPLPPRFGRRAAGLGGAALLLIAAVALAISWRGGQEAGSATAAPAARSAVATRAPAEPPVAAGVVPLMEKPATASAPPPVAEPATKRPSDRGRVRARSSGVAPRPPSTHTAPPADRPAVQIWDPDSAILP